jgi:hypothetical protein
VLLLAVPFALLALAMPPRRLVMQIIGVALLALLLSARGTGTLFYFERGWALLIGSWFVVAVMVMPGAQFVGRALAALGASAATCAVFLTANRGAFARLDADISTRLHTAANATIESLKQMSAGKQGGMDLTQMMASMTRVADMQTLLFPAMLATASLAALGASWWLYRRFAAKDEQPLRPLREFRFSDHLVWMLIIGAILMLVPSLGAGPQRVGSNIVLFMTMLYALRGLAVFVMIGAAPGPFGIVIGAILFVVLYPLVLGATVLVGLTDTWLDIRKKRPIAPTPGS